MDLSKAPSKAKKISEVISKKIDAKRGSNDIDLNGVIKTLAKRNVEATKNDE